MPWAFTVSSHIKRLSCRALVDVLEVVRAGEGVRVGVAAVTDALERDRAPANEILIEGIMASDALSQVEEAAMLEGIDGHPLPPACTVP